MLNLQMTNDLSGWLSCLSSPERKSLDEILQQAGPTFREWLSSISPVWRWDWPHLAMIQHELERVRSADDDQRDERARDEHAENRRPRGDDADAGHRRGF